MIRVLNLVALFVVISLCSKAQLPLDQQRYYDSLTTILQHTRSDSIKARAHYALVYYWVPRDTAKARQCLDEARRLSKQYPFLQAISYGHEGYIYYSSDIDRSDASFAVADSLLNSFATKEAYQARANVWINRAAIRQRKDDDRGYIDIVLNRAIPYALKAGDSAIVASQYVGVGLAFMNLEQYDKAEPYFDKAIRIFQSINTQPSRLVAALNRAGENYVYLKKYDEAKKIVATVKTLLAPYPDSELYAVHYMVEGLCYLHDQQYTQAEASFNKGITAARGPNKAYVIQELSFYKVKALLANKKYEPAKQQLLELSSNEEVMELGSSRLEIYEGLATSYAGLGQMKPAYEWMKQARHLSDSLHESDLANDINDLEIKYQRAESQKEIITLKAKNEQAALSAKNSRLYILLLASTTLLLLIVATFALLYYRSNRKLLMQKELNHRQELKDIEQQQRLQFGQAVLQGEEQERRRLARDLHDGLGGMLAGVKINLSGQVEKIAAEQQGELRKTISQLDDSVTELRRIAHNMMPANLLKFGLQTALKDLSESLMTAAVKIDFQAYGIEPSMPEQTQINIYRIVQELLANAMRHAEASNIILQCSQDGDTFLITQEDNGKGFDTSVNGKGIGLSNIRNRVGFLRGMMDITSVINEGTTINIELHVG
ncbi:histidine kinase [Chitinophaga filiformis]|uniref:tetratricopeptide repeat-containing sensor histidine kinase n=1 Tax=Chitinophaga filiformis TaxID=104663 RepID=UPI001F2992AD|nr:sensor histidine kinase [Chitinophaga filiformis]MCF6402559.1 histidine kinase [Chitinophaga filiformis]MCF6403523.1 histidine kinase [Chitinophaga filiformis]